MMKHLMIKMKTTILRQRSRKAKLLSSQAQTWYVVVIVNQAELLILFWSAIGVGYKHNEVSTTTGREPMDRQLFLMLAVS